MPSQSRRLLVVKPFPGAWHLTYSITMPCLPAFMLVLSNAATHVYGTIPELGIKTKVNLVSKNNLA